MRAIQMLRQDRVFDRPEKGGMDAEQEHRAEHQRQPEVRMFAASEQQASAAHHHDSDFRRFHPADDLGLVEGIGELAGKRGQEKEREDREARRQRVEVRFDARVIEDVIGGEQHHRLLEQIVVERSQELRDEQRKKAALLEQAERTDHGRKRSSAWPNNGSGIAQPKPVRQILMRAGFRRAAGLVTA